MTVKNLLSNVQGAFNYFEAYDAKTLEQKVHIYDAKSEKRLTLNDSLDKEVIDYNLNGENWTIAIYV